MAVVSVSIETDTTATNRELPTRKQPVHESCPMPILSSAASRLVRLSILEPGCVGAADQLGRDCRPGHGGPRLHKQRRGAAPTAHWEVEDLFQ
jgi:hypothetical protein